MISHKGQDVANLYSNIPEELRLLPNWVLWRFENKPGATKPTKVPYQPNGHKANPVFDKTFSSFQDCFNALSFGSYDGLGFVFTNSEYAGIDLDDASLLPITNEPNPNYQLDLARQIRIAHEFDSYSEVSPSGKGLHIIVKGSVPSGINNRKASIEIYSTGRYFTMTGNVHNNKPVAEYNALLNSLWNEMGGKIEQPIIEGGIETSTDDEIIALAFKHNTDTFTRLFNADLSGYPSQSEADQAFANILAYYTNSKAQVERIFRNSKLMRPKFNINKKYLSITINKAFDQKVPNIDISGLKEALELKLFVSCEAKSNSTIINGMTPDFFKPLGLLGEVAQFVYDDSPRQIAEAAFLAADCFFGGIGGKAYNISGTGLNQYNLLLADTGYGKGAVENCIDRLVHYVIKYAREKGYIVAADQLKSHIGPTFASGQGLIAQLAMSNCFSSTLDEFGLLLAKISDTKASGADRAYYSNLLQLYNKSGHMQTFKGVKHSKKDNDIPEIKSPSVTLALLSTASSYYDVVKSSDFANGLIPRIFTMEYTGDRPSLNLNAHNVIPSDDLLQKICDYVGQCISISSMDRVTNIKISNEMRLSLDNYVGDKIKKAVSNNQKAVADLWSRAEMKAMKKAGLFASCINPWAPEVTYDLMSIAFGLIENDIIRTANHITEGSIVGDDLELKACGIVASFLSRYIQSNFKDLPNQKNAIENLHASKIIGWSYLQNSVGLNTVAKHMKSTPSVVFIKAMDNLIKGGYINRVTVNGFDGACYKINNRISNDY